MTAPGRTMYDFGPLHFDSKADLLARSREFWNPGKTAFWVDSGVDLVLDRREGYLLWDMDGRRLIDAHLNGGTYNLGHRNPEIVAAVVEGLQRFDIGNHHFPSPARTALAQALVSTAPASPRCSCPTVPTSSSRSRSTTSTRWRRRCADPTSPP